MINSSTFLKYILLPAAIIAWLFTLGSLVSDVLNNRDGLVGIAVVPQDDGLVISFFRTGQNEYQGLLIGDLITAVGGREANSQVNFTSYVLDQSGPISVRRGSQILEFDIAVPERPLGVARALSSLVWGVLGIVSVFFLNQKYQNYNLALVFLAMSMTAGAHGPSETTYYANILCASIANAALLIFGHRWLLQIDNIASPGWLSLLPFAYSIQFVVIYSAYVNWPIPAGPLTDLLLLLTVILWLLHWLIVAFNRYPRYSQDTKRVMQYVATSASVCLTVFILGFLAARITGNIDFYLYALVCGQLLAAMIFLLAFSNTMMIEIEPLAVTTVAYAILAIGLGIFAEFVAEPMATLASDWLGLPEQTGQTLLIVGIALTGPTLKNSISPVIAKMFRAQAK